MVDQPANSESPRDFESFIRISCGILAAIVCLAGLSAAVSCFFGAELKVLFGLRALIVSGAAGYGAYYCYSTLPKTELENLFLSESDTNISEKRP